MPNYENAKVYKIVSPNTDSVYYGSTTQTLKQRFSQHKKQTCESRLIIDAGDASIVQIECFPCTNRYDLEDREAYFIMNDRARSVNKNMPGAFRRVGGIRNYNHLPEIVARRRKHNRTRTLCTCGIWTTKAHISEHRRTARHARLMAAQKEEAAAEEVAEVAPVCLLGSVQSC